MKRRFGKQQGGRDPVCPFPFAAGLGRGESPKNKYVLAAAGRGKQAASGASEEEAGTREGVALGVAWQGLTWSLVSSGTAPVL